MTAATALDLATIQEYCRILRLAAVAAQCERLAQDAPCGRSSHRWPS